MKRAGYRALRLLVVWAMGLLALVGLGLSGAFILVSTDAGRGLIIPRLIRAADEALAGRIELDSFQLEPGGGIRLQGVRVFDPGGELVLSAPRAFAAVDLARLRSRTVVLRLDVERPEVLLKRQPDGSLSLAEAFAPRRPSARPDTGPSAWTIRLAHLAIRGGSLRYVGAAGTTEVDAREISLEGRGDYGRQGARAELKLRSQLAVPTPAATSLELEGALRRGALRISVLRASVGDSALDAVAEGDLRRRSGRVAILGARLSGAEARRLAPLEPLTGELEGVAYAESDGRKATGAFDVRSGASRGGSAQAAVALHLTPGRPAAGFEATFDQFDPSRLVVGAPSGSISFTAHGRAAGRTLEDLRGAITVALKPSRLRSGRIGPGELTALASSGTVDVGRLTLSLPGGNVEGSGRYAPRGAVAGQLSAESADLAALERNLEALLGAKLPSMTGRARLSADVEGSAAVPVARVSLSAPVASVANLSVRSLAISGELRGPRQAPQGRFEGGAQVVAVGPRELRQASLRASVVGRSADLTFSGLLPDLGEEPVAVQGTGELSEDRTRLLVSRLTVAFPGTRFGLVKPAEVALQGPSVDRLELVAGEARLVLAGGFRGGSLDVNAAAEALPLGRIPPRLLPPDWKLDGQLSVAVHATGQVETVGTASRVRDLAASAQVRLAGGRFRGVKGLSAAADLQYQGERRRAAVRLDAHRAEGGDLSLSGELPVEPARSALESPLMVKVGLRSFPLADLLRLGNAAGASSAAGLASLEGTLTGTLKLPAVEASLDLVDAGWGEWGPGTIHLALQGEGARLKLGGFADLRGARLLLAEAQLPLDLTGLLRAPGRVARELPAALVNATLTVPGYDLSRVAGMGTLPQGISGTVAGKAVLRGSWRAPRLQATLDLSQGAYQAYTGLGLHAEAQADDAAVKLTARGTLRTSEVLRLSAKLGRPLERLMTGAHLDEAPLSAEAILPETALGEAQPSFPLTGRVEGNLKAGGTLGAPQLDLELRARRLALSAAAIGDLAASVHYATSRGRIHGELKAAGGGNLVADLGVTADLGLAALRRTKLESAPAEARLVASRLDLGFLPTVAPGWIHSAQGTLQADLRARGPLSRLKPLGTLRVEASRVAVVEFGEWSNIVVDASLDEDLLRVSKLEAHRGGGWVTAELQGRGLSRKEGAELTGTCVVRTLTLSRAGQELITIDHLDLSLRGKLQGEELRGDVVIPTALVRLPEQSPRPLQSLEVRSDISIGRPRTPKAAAGAGGRAALPLHVLLHVLVPNRFFVEGESPRIRGLELKADLTVEEERGELTMTGTVSTIRGRVEPISGRVFNIERGRVQFTGGPPRDAILDVSASYDNPKAKVQVAVSGPVTRPQIRMSSQPPLEESQIALLLATGRTELKANSGGVGTLDSEDASRAALGSVASQLFKNLVASKLPVDTAVEPGRIRAGVYLSDQAYVGYTRRFDLQQQQQHVNQNELRFEYQFSPRWNLELRYGDAGAGGASLVWQKDY